MTSTQLHISFANIRVLLLLYPMVSQSILMMFNCQEIGDSYYLVQDRSIVCYTYTWAFYATIGFVGFGVWVAGVPVLFFISVYRARYRNVSERLKLLEKPQFLPLRKKWTKEMREYNASKGIFVKEKEFMAVENVYLAEYMCYKNLQVCGIEITYSLQSTHCRCKHRTQQLWLAWALSIKIVRLLEISLVLINLPTYANLSIDERNFWWFDVTELIR